MIGLNDGTQALAEVHWYAAYGIGKVKMKVKRWLWSKAIVETVFDTIRMTLAASPCRTTLNYKADAFTDSLCSIPHEITSYHHGRADTVLEGVMQLPIWG
ncbi:MAG: hypothetical protein M1492_04520 [Gammaproteobacteria bacterium]|nr:hypothetical protein [Gammaproteobacteria bacterium]